MKLEYFGGPFDGGVLDADEAQEGDVISMVLVEGQHIHGYQRGPMLTAHYIGAVEALEVDEQWTA